MNFVEINHFEWITRKLTLGLPYYILQKFKKWLNFYETFKFLLQKKKNNNNVLIQFPS